MSEMHELIMDSTTKILKENCTKELINSVEAGQWPEELWNILVESGITMVGVPDSLGGAGGDQFDAFHILRLAGKYALPLPLAETLITNWLLAEQGESPLAEPLTFSLHENNALKIDSGTNGYVVTGTVKNVAWARFAKKLLVNASLNGKEMMLVLPLEKAQITRNHNLAGEPIDTVHFEQVEVQEEKMYQIDREKTMKHVMYLGALSKAVMMSGALEEVLELTIQYAKEREQFGRPLIKLQAIQQYLSTISGETVAALTISNKAIQAFEQGDFDEIATAKLQVNESAGLITDIAHQVHGAIGVTHEHRLHQLTRRLWSWREEFGNENYWAEQLTTNMLNSETQSLWDYITRDSKAIAERNGTHV